MGSSVVPMSPPLTQPLPGSEAPMATPILLSMTPAPICPLTGLLGRSELTFVAPHGKEGEDGRPIVSHVAQGQGRAIFVGEGGTGGREKDLS